MQENEAGVARPGELYRRYRTVEELPENAKAFYELAGKFIIWFEHTELAGLTFYSHNCRNLLEDARKRRLPDRGRNREVDSCGEKESLG